MLYRTRISKIFQYGQTDVHVEISPPDDSQDFSCSLKEEIKISECLQKQIEMTSKYILMSVALYLDQ